MTTTNVFSGNFTDKPSSRVLRPPGGGSSNIFGGPEEVKKPVKKVENNIFGSPQEVNKVQENVENTKNKEEESSVKKDKLAEDTSQKQPSFKPKLQAGSYNPITGESYANENVNRGKPSTAVRQPPGGASSGLW